MKKIVLSENTLCFMCFELKRRWRGTAFWGGPPQGHVRNRYVNIRHVRNREVNVRRNTTLRRLCKELLSKYSLCKESLTNHYDLFGKSYCE